MAENITQLLLRWSDGDQSALDQLMPLVYGELRKLARGYLRRHAHNHTMQPTVLVNEVYLRLVNQRQVTWENRAQFFGLASKLMRNLLVDYARHRHANKRGGGDYHLSLTYVDQSSQQPQTGIDLIALDEALNRLAVLSPQQGKIVELRFFGGLTIPETASAMGISHATVEREWSAARAWLYSQLK